MGTFNTGVTVVMRTSHTYPNPKKQSYKDAVITCVAYVPSWGIQGTGATPEEAIQDLKSSVKVHDLMEGRDQHVPFVEMIGEIPLVRPNDGMANPTGDWEWSDQPVELNRLHDLRRDISCTIKGVSESLPDDQREAFLASVFAKEPGPDLDTCILNWWVKAQLSRIGAGRFRMREAFDSTRILAVEVPADPKP